MKSKVCPICKKSYIEHSAISRTDNETEICSECGLKEAFENFIKQQFKKKEGDKKKNKK